ncbi:MAG: prolyl oligopeptidase family serine peptidase [Pseudomonadota bacterium]
MNNRMRRNTALLSCVFLLACNHSSPGVGTVNLPAASPVPAASDTFCGKTSWVAGIHELCSGHLVYRDYIYDDYGAKADVPAAEPPGAGGASSSGDARYPADAVNTADLVRLELWLDGNDIVVEAELNTLYTATQTIVALALDTDNNPATGTQTLLDLTVTGADLVQQFNEGDPATNLVRGRFPKPADDTWKIWAVTAQSDGTVMNLAFRGTDEVTSVNGAFWEDTQAAALQSGDISAFGASVNVSDLMGGTTRGFEVKPGFHQRVYTSTYTLPPGEGISAEGVPGRHGRTSSGCEQYFNYLGKYQPYAFFLPSGAGPHALVVSLHGCDSNHSHIARQDVFQKQFGEDLNRIIVQPLGRGADGWFTDISERDVLDVLDDTLHEYDVDPDQVIVAGYSMGGYGVMHLAALYPDLWAAAVTWVGNTASLYNTPLPGNPVTAAERQLGDLYREQFGTTLASGDSGAISDVVDFIGNLRHIPLVSLYSGADYLVPVNTALYLRQKLGEAAGVIYDFYLHPTAEHLTYAVLDSWQKEADFSANRKRVKNPAQVTYRTDAQLAFPEYAIQHDRAYWVSDIVGRAEGYIDVDLKSLGCGQPEPQFMQGDDTGVGPLVLAWQRHFRQLAGETATTAQNRIEGTLANVSSLTIDSKASCLSPGTAYRLTIDGPVTLRFSDGRSLSLSAAGLNEGTLK